MGNDISRIDTGFFICGVEALKDVERLQRLGIKYVLNVAQRGLYNRPGRLITKMGGFEEESEDLYDKMTKAGITVEIIGAEDCQEQDLSPFFERMANYIEEGRKAGGVVIHCAAGVSRASTTCISYMMLKEGMKVDAAYQKIHHVRDIVHPNAGFWRQLRDLEKLLLSRGVELRDLIPDELRPLGEEDKSDRPSQGRTGLEMIEMLNFESRDVESFTSIFLTARVGLKPSSLHFATAFEKIRGLPEAVGLTWSNFEAIDETTIGLRVGVIASRSSTASADVEGEIRKALGDDVASIDIEDIEHVSHED